MNQDEVFDRFCLLADLSYDEAQNVRCLCDDAFLLLDSQKKEGTPPEADSVLCTAAAAFALYRWTLLRHSSGERGFSAGSVQVNVDGKIGAEMACRAWEEARAAAAPYLVDSDFLFERICS